MTKAKWVIVVLLLNLLLAGFFLYVYREFQSAEKIQTTQSVPEALPMPPASEDVETELAPSSPPLKKSASKKERMEHSRDKSYEAYDSAGASSPTLQEFREVAKAPAPKETSPLKDLPVASAPSQVQNQASISQAIPTTLESTAKYSRSLLLMGLASSLFLNFGLLILYRSYAGQAVLAKKRQDFVSAVTHELRTPLTSIKMFGELLEDGMGMTEEKKKEYYGLINKESGRLSRLVDNMLQLSSLEKKNYRPQLVTESLRDSLDQIVPDLDRLAATSGFILETDFASVPAVTFDRDAVHQILFIFLENSLKFAAGSDNKKLRLSLQKLNEKVILSWNDFGPGVPEEELSKIFEPFYRVENELMRKTKGTGIGLAMAKMLSEAMNASLEAHNEEGLSLRLIFQD